MLFKFVDDKTELGFDFHSLHVWKNAYGHLYFSLQQIVELLESDFDLVLDAIDPAHKAQHRVRLENNDPVSFWLVSEPGVYTLFFFSKNPKFSYFKKTFLKFLCEIRTDNLSVGHNRVYLSEAWDSIWLPANVVHSDERNFKILDTERKNKARTARRLKRKGLPKPKQEKPKDVVDLKFSEIETARLTAVKYVLASKWRERFREQKRCEIESELL